MAPLKYPYLIPRAHEYFALRGKRKLANVIKLRLLRWRDYYHCNPEDSYEKKAEGQY